MRAEFSAVQRFEDLLQRQYDDQLRSHVHAPQDERRKHVGGQEENKMQKELQHALTQESNMCQDQLQQTLQQQICQEENADAESTRKMNQLHCMVSEQEDAMVRLEATSQQNFSHQYAKHAHKQQTLFQEFDGAIKDKDATLQSMP